LHTTVKILEFVVLELNQTRTIKLEHQGSHNLYYLYLQYSKLVFKSVGSIQFSLSEKRSNIFLQFCHVCIMLFKFRFQGLQHNKQNNAHNTAYIRNGTAWWHNDY